MSSVLLEKWKPVLDESDTVEAIKDPHRRKVTAQLLENQEASLAENANTNLTGGSLNWDPVLISLVRRMTPMLIAYDICGVQPMNAPTGLLFALKARTTNQTGAEAMGLNEVDAAFSGAGASEAGTDPWGVHTGIGMDTAVGETQAWASMGVTIEKTNVVAKTRQLRADYSLELAQDMRAMHGLDAEAELTNILQTEIISEQNREIVRTVYYAANAGAQFATTPGTYDLQADSDGRWSAERFKGLVFAIERDANAIARVTRRGKGNILITTSDVASALALAGVLSYAPLLAGMTSLEVDATGATYAGTMGRFKVYIDPYLQNNGYVVGFKGASQYDAGFFYCPYVPLQLVRATDPSNFQPALGFKTRYGMVANPFTVLTAGGNTYYRKALVTNLL